VSEQLGVPLSQILKTEKFDEKKARFYGAEILLGLEYLHSHEIVYRNLSLETVLMYPDGHIKLSGFHLSKKLPGDTTTKTFCGAPEFMPPELKLGETVEHGKAYDWWSFGTLLHRLVTGEYPFLIGLKKLNGTDPKDFAKLQKLKTQEKLETHFSQFITMDARDILINLLDPDPTRRVRDAKSARVAPFFRKHLDWEKMAKREVDPPIKPSAFEGKSFDGPLEEEAQGEFEEIEGFTYTAPSVLNA